MDARRLELYELLKPKLDEESARALVLALPADPDNLATKDGLARLAQQESTLTRRMITIMGAWTVLVGSAFGWTAVLLR